MSDSRVRSRVGELPTIWKVDDALWVLLAPLLVIEKPRLKPGRPRADDRRLFNGLIWLARTGSQWSVLPACFGPSPRCTRASRSGSRTARWKQPGHGCWSGMMVRSGCSWSGKRQMGA